MVRWEAGKMREGEEIGGRKRKAKGDNSVLELQNVTEKSVIMIGKGLASI